MPFQQAISQFTQGRLNMGVSPLGSAAFPASGFTTYHCGARWERPALVTGALGVVMPSGSANTGFRGVSIFVPSHVTVPSAGTGETLQ